MTGEPLFWLLLFTFGAGSYVGQCITDHYWDRIPKQWWIDKRQARRAARYAEAGYLERAKRERDKAS